MLYEWDEAKEKENRRKHRIDFAEAASIFLDPLALTYPDPDHSVSEQRFITIGTSNRQRVLFVAHLDADEEQVRIISARRATKREAHDYNEG